VKVNVTVGVVESSRQGMFESCWDGGWPWSIGATDAKSGRFEEPGLDQVDARSSRSGGKDRGSSRSKGCSG
jgi:hypothetical protein